MDDYDRAYQAQQDAERAWVEEGGEEARANADAPVTDTPLTAEEWPDANPVGTLREKLMYELRYLHFTSNGNDGQLCGARRGVSIDTCPGACRVIKLAISEIAALTERAERAEAEVTRLTTTGVRADERREMQKAVAEAQAAEERTKRAEARVAELEAALADLCDEQNGPPLLRDADSWQAAMNNAWRVLGRALEGTR